MKSLARNAFLVKIGGSRLYEIKGSHVNIWGDKTEIREGTSIGDFVEIGNAIIGRNCSIQAFCFLCEGVTLEDNVFLGPRVTFTNDKYPPSPKENWLPILVKEGASIGAGAIICPGVTIGRGARVGAGAIVTKDVPDGETWMGNPAKSRHQQMSEVGAGR